MSAILLNDPNCPGRFRVPICIFDEVVGDDLWAPDEIRNFMRRGPCNPVFYLIAESHILQYLGRKRSARIFASLINELIQWRRDTLNEGVPWHDRKH